jgi:FecR protein
VVAVENRQVAAVRGAAGDATIWSFLDHPTRLAPAVTARTRLVSMATMVLVLAFAGAAYLAVRVATITTLKHLRLADGTVARFRTDSSVAAARGFPATRTLAVNGDVYLEVPNSAQPLIVESRLLRLTVQGRAALRVTAYSAQTGAQVQVIFGDVLAFKNYVSNYAEPDHLGAGQMSMVNQSIDLMEKESFNPDELRGWAKKLGARIDAR